MHSNNEIGTLMPIREIAAIARERNVLIHADAAQSMGKVVVDVQELGRRFPEHRRPQALCTKRDRRTVHPRRRRSAVLHSRRRQEDGRRAGTEKCPISSASAKRPNWQRSRCRKRPTNCEAFRDRLEAHLKEKLGDRLVVNGHPRNRLPNTANVSFFGKVGSELLEDCQGIAASTGAACHEGQFIMSPIFHALGISERVGMGGGAIDGRALYDRVRNRSSRGNAVTGWPD